MKSLILTSKEELENTNLPIYNPPVEIEVDFSDYSIIDNYIPAGGNQWAESTDFTHLLIPIPVGCRRVKFYVGSLSYCYCFLKGTNNTGTIPFATGENGRHICSEDLSVAILADATHVYVLYTNPYFSLPYKMEFIL